MKKKLPYLIVCGVIVTIIVIIIIRTPKRVEVPNLVGMTVQKAETIVKDLGFTSLTVRDMKGRSVEDKQAIIVSQSWEPGIKLTVDSVFMVYVDNNIGDKELKIEKTIKDFANRIREQQNGAIKYSNYDKYKVTQSDVQVYRIKYITSIESMYYYQLVSLDSNNEMVSISSDLFVFNTYGSGQNLELEYAYEKLWN